MPDSYLMYVLDEYLIMYSPEMKTEKFSCEQYHGISFFTEEGQVDVLHNKDLGTRLIYNLKNVGWHDIPFKPATFGFLPNGVEAKEIG
jgi:hypothetical protein